MNYGFPGEHMNPNNCFYQTGIGYSSDEQLEEFLMLKLEFVYNEVISKLIGLGYSESASLKAVLSNGHCYGGKDLLDNILNNSIKALKRCNGDQKEPKTVFSDLKQLEKYALTGLVCLLQQLRPNLSKGFALWCLLVTDLNIGRATTIKIPVPGHEYPVAPVADLASAAVAVASAATTAAFGGHHNISFGGMIVPHKSQFHGRQKIVETVSKSSGGGSGDTHEMNFQLQRKIEYPKRFNLTPAMMSALKRNVATFASVCRENLKQSQSLTNDVSGNSSTMSNLAFPDVSVTPNERSCVVQCLDDQDITKDLVSKLYDLSLHENGLVAEDERDQVIMSLLHQIKDLENQVKEQQEWAQEKAFQAAKKLTSDLTELKTLRMERGKIRMLKQGKHQLDDVTVKKLSEAESGLRSASIEMDRSTIVARKLEQENAEIRAEIEASKLSASETVIACQKVAKREKTLLKKVHAREKQNAKIQKEITDEKEKIMQTEEELNQIRQIRKEAEVRLEEELKAKEDAMELVEKEGRSKEADESNCKRNVEALRLKIEIDFQRYEDDVRRLEHELLRLQAAAESAELQSNASPESGFDDLNTEIIAKLLQELDNLEDFSEKNKVKGGRECIICKKDKVSIVFLPCAHQVMCASCSDLYGEYGQAFCPCCRSLIERRIHVFGASA